MSGISVKRPWLAEANRKRVWTPEARAKCAEAARKQRHSPEFKARMSLRLMGNQYTKGRVHTAKTKAKLSASWKPSKRRSEGMRRHWRGISVEERRARLRPALIASVNTSVSRLELIVRKLLDELGVSYIPTKQLGPYFVDIYIPAKKLVVECDGAYWHGRPDMRERDRKRDGWMRKNGYKVLRLLEEEISDLASATLLRFVA